MERWDGILMRRDYPLVILAGVVVVFIALALKIVMT